MADKELIITKAEYGVPGVNMVDVKDKVTSLINDGSLSFTVSPETFGIPDPAPGVIKTVKIDGTLSKVALHVEKNDGEQVSINPKVQATKVTGPFEQIQNSIWYGVVALIGTYMAYSIYYIGSKGIGSYVIGALLAMYVGYLFMRAAFSTSGALVGAVISIPIQIVFWVYLYSLLYPNSINFEYGAVPPPQ